MISRSLMARLETQLDTLETVLGGGRAAAGETAAGGRVVGARTSGTPGAASRRLWFDSPIAYVVRDRIAGLIVSARRDGIHVARAPITRMIATGTANAGQSGSNTLPLPPAAPRASASRAGPMPDTTPVTSVMTTESIRIAESIERSKNRTLSPALWTMTPSSASS